MSRAKRKAFITGADGYLGHALNRRFREAGWTVVESGLASSKREDYISVDIRDGALVAGAIADFSPDIVVHTAGISSLQECETNRELAFETNVKGTSHVVDGVLRCDPRPMLVFLSSDYVFDGETGGYIETSERAPRTYYGETKLRAEDEIMARLESYLVLRTSNVYGGGGNFFMFLMENLRRRRAVDLFTNTYYTPTYLDFFTSSVLSLLRREMKGVYHVAGRERISRYEFGRIACEALGVDGSLARPCEQPSSGLVARDSSLSTRHPAAELGMFNPTPAESFQYLLGNKVFPYFEREDSRGLLRGLCRGGPWREVNHVRSVKGTERGNHWHRDTSESFYIINGRISVRVKDLLSGQERSFVVTAGDFFTIPPATLHVFSMLDDAEWINLLSSPIDDDAPDILTTG